MKKNLILLSFCTDLQRCVLLGCARINMVPPKLTTLKEAKETSPPAGKLSPGEPTDLQVCPGAVSSPGIPQDHALRSWLSNSTVQPNVHAQLWRQPKEKGYLHWSVANCKHKWSFSAKTLIFCIKSR